MSFAATFIVLSLLGIATSMRLIWQHRKKKEQPLVCPLNHDCSVVTESRWSHIFGVRNEVLGLLFYVAMLLAALGIVLSLYEEVLHLFIRIAALIGVLFSAFLVYVQAEIIKDYCFYCLISALITLLLLVNGFFL